MGSGRQPAENSALRRLPAVHSVLGDDDINPFEGYPHDLVVGAVRRVLERHRQRLLAASEATGESTAEEAVWVPSVAELREEALDYLSEAVRPTLRQVVNATGVVLHTNLGRAPLARAARERVQQLAGSYTNLEYDLDRGERGSRYTHVTELLCRLTGAEAALVVNNNAGAVLLVLSTVARGGEVVVSRGELVEIGGSFRIPDVMAQSGATLVEVGTTNKTRISDYRQAVTEDTRALMKVHTSNYRVVGFTASVQTAELVRLGRELDLPVIEDLGSGVLIDLEKQGLAPEPTAQSVLEAGVDVVTFSGDKLLGGPQAGVILGAEEWIAECRRHPLTRALRVGKLTLAALEETLLVYQRGPDALRELPVYELLLLGPEELQPRAEELMNRLHSDFGDELVIDAVQGHSRVGGGALPLSQLPSVLVSVRADGISTAELELRLRKMPEVPLIGRVQNDRFLMDMRTVRREEFALVAAAFDVALERGGGAQ